MSDITNYDLIIIGGGPAGYIGAIRAAQLGIKTLLVEKQAVGGMCLNWGCIPMKVILESARQYQKIKYQSDYFGITGVESKSIGYEWDKIATRKDKVVNQLVKGVEFLLKKNKVQQVIGEAEILNHKTILVNHQEIKTDHILIATGSIFSPLPLKKKEQYSIWEVQDLLNNQSIADHYVIVGNNPVAFELANLLHLLDKKIIQVIPDDKILPYLDNSLINFLRRKWKKNKIELILEPELEKALQNLDSGVPIINSYQRIAVLPKTHDFTLEMEQTHLLVNANQQTSESHIYAAGDVTGTFLAQFASAQSLRAVNHIAGIQMSTNSYKIPKQLYLSPEIASLGVT
ncbi:MAG: NAD(P)/FAD-dependent oxidoreductase, partial [Spirochaetes bacterium]|nr:NAD(P)/FAD-dependent oxidoreductase [Spirochaetota bacterium]